MSVLVRRYKLPNGLVQEDRIDEPERIDRYIRMLNREDVRKLHAGQKVQIEKDEWRLIEEE